MTVVIKIVDMCDMIHVELCLALIFFLDFDDDRHTRRSYVWHDPSRAVYSIHLLYF